MAAGILSTYQDPPPWKAWYDDSLTHWGRVTHICVGNLTIMGSDNGLSPDRRQAIIWTNAGMLLIGPLGTNFSEILAEIITFSFKKMYLKKASAKWRPFCLGLKVLMDLTRPAHDWTCLDALVIAHIGPYQITERMHLASQMTFVDNDSAIKIWLAIELFICDKGDPI